MAQSAVASGTWSVCDRSGSAHRLTVEMCFWIWEDSASYSGPHTHFFADWPLRLLFSTSSEPSGDFNRRHFGKISLTICFFKSLWFTFGHVWNNKQDKKTRGRRKIYSKRQEKEQILGGARVNSRFFYNRNAFFRLFYLELNESLKSIGSCGGKCIKM